MELYMCFDRIFLLNTMVWNSWEFPWVEFCGYRFGCTTWFDGRLEQFWLGFLVEMWLFLQINFWKWDFVCFTVTHIYGWVSVYDLYNVNLRDWVLWKAQSVVEQYTSHISHQSLLWGLVDWTFFLRSEVSSHLLGTQQFDLLHLGPLLSFIKAGSPHTRLNTGLWGRRWASGLQIAVGYSLWAGTVGPLMIFDGQPINKAAKHGVATISCQH